jgi:hypothetical protein
MFWAAILLLSWFLLSFCAALLEARIFGENRAGPLFWTPILNIFYSIYLTYKLCQLKQSLIKSYLPKFRGE